MWPPAADEKFRKGMLWAGCIAAFFYAAIWGLIVLAGAVVWFVERDTSATRTFLTAIPHFLIALAVGWGILKKSRTAALTGLVLTLAGVIAAWVASGPISRDSIQFLIFAWMLAQSVRATFAYHRAAEAG